MSITSSPLQHIHGKSCRSPDEFNTSVSIGGRPVYNLRFTDFDLLGGNEGELQQLTERREKAVAMEMSRILINSIEER